MGRFKDVHRRVYGWGRGMDERSDTEKRWMRKMCRMWRRAEYLSSI